MTVNILNSVSLCVVMTTRNLNLSCTEVFNKCTKSAKLQSLIEINHYDVKNKYNNENKNNKIKNSKNNNEIN